MNVQTFYELLNKHRFNFISVDRQVVDTTNKLDETSNVLLTGYRFEMMEDGFKLTVDPNKNGLFDCSEIIGKKAYGDLFLEVLSESDQNNILVAEEEATWKKYEISSYEIPAKNHLLLKYTVIK